MKRRTFIKNAAASALAPSLGYFLANQNVLAESIRESGLRDLYGDCFLMGTMVPLRKYLVPDEKYLNIVKNDFNSIATQNVFKWENVHPGDAHWNWAYTDRFVDFGKSLGMHMVGHNLVSGSELPAGLLLETPTEFVSRDKLQRKLDNHVSSLVERYKGRIHAWDVVNEAIDDIESGWVRNAWYNIMGAEYVERAFSLAREADPDATLIYNDYNLSKKNKRDFAVEMIRDLKGKGVPIDAIGMQGHFSLEGPHLDEVEASIEAFAAEGVRIHFTEMEVDVLPSPPPEPTEEELEKEDYKPLMSPEELDPWRDQLPANIEANLRKRYQDIFSLLIKHKDKIDRVTFWGTTDDDSWKNNFPLEGRVNHPLLFDRNHNPKSAYRAIAELRK